MKFPTLTKLPAMLLAVSMLSFIQAGCSKQAAPQQTVVPTSRVVSVELPPGSGQFVKAIEQTPGSGQYFLLATPAPGPVAAATAAPAVPAPSATASPAAPAAAVLPPTGPDASVTLTTAAWNAFNDKNYDQAIASAQKCINLYQKQALDMQATAKTTPPTTDDQKKEQWALNDVGTCYYIVGQSNEKSGKKKEAVDAYKYLVDNLPGTLCWDPKGWFWSPAKVAQTSLKGLQLDTLQ